MNLFQCKELNKSLLDSFKDMIQKVDTEVNDYTMNEMKLMAGNICAVHFRLFVYVIKQCFSVCLCAFYSKSLQCGIFQVKVSHVTYSV